jgi:hypothetical protein
MPSNHSTLLRLGFLALAALAVDASFIKRTAEFLCPGDYFLELQRIHFAVGEEKFTLDRKDNDGDNAITAMEKHRIGKAMLFEQYTDKRTDRKWNYFRIDAGDYGEDLYKQVCRFSSFPGVASWMDQQLKSVRGDRYDYKVTMEFEDPNNSWLYTCVTEAGIGRKGHRTSEEMLKMRSPNITPQDKLELKLLDKPSGMQLKGQPITRDTACKNFVRELSQQVGATLVAGAAAAGIVYGIQAMVGV